MNTRLKIILIGDGRVGKTSIINKYINNKFNDDESMTQNVCFTEKTILYNEKKYNFAIWDTAGQEKFNSITSIYYRDAKGVLLVYDVTNKKSFDRVKKWIEELKIFNENFVLVIVGNKFDIKDAEEYVDTKSAEDYSKEHGALHFYTSAKTGHNINEAFESLIMQVINNFEKENKKGKTKTSRKVLTKNASLEEEEESSKCCYY